MLEKGDDFKADIAYGNEEEDRDDFVVILDTSNWKYFGNFCWFGFYQ